MQTRTFNSVRVDEILTIKFSSSDRQTLAELVESEVHLAHALVRYLGVDGPEALAKYDIRGVGELVDFISRVRLTLLNK